MRHCSLRETISPTDDKGGGISNLALNVSGSRQFYAQFSLIWNVYFCQQSHLCPHLALEPGKLIKKWPFFFLEQFWGCCSSLIGVSEDERKRKSRLLPLTALLICVGWNRSGSLKYFFLISYFLNILLPLHFTYFFLLLFFHLAN